MNKTEYDKLIQRSIKAQKAWQDVPAPQRGELIKHLATTFKYYQQELAADVTQESKKIIAEATGEVQEAIDMCDFGVGLSRQLYGLTMSSERQDHRLQEMWHPLGVVGVISAFNFPVAVWAWNHVLAIICGNSVVWKPSPKTIGVAYKCKDIWDTACFRAIKDGYNIPKDLLIVLEGHTDVAEWMADDQHIKLLSATGSTEMGKALAPRVAARLGRGLYELGGNNAMIVSEHANIDLTVRAIVFSAVGTCGQRCTTLRRLIVNKKVYKPLLAKLKRAYNSLSVGSPSDPKNLVGPLISKDAFDKMQEVLGLCRMKAYAVHGGDPIWPMENTDDYYVNPAIVEVDNQCNLVKSETFAPILYLMKYDYLDEAIYLQNDVPQGLSSCIFTDNLQEAETFISAHGSDCGIVNVNVGTSGAEIGGAFGGEKDTGGGRESGSDAWKSYMRRSTITINYGSDLPLAQGINFDL
jgi:aldehyde dehydrogenase (NAD+)